ncbi:L-aspartate oxidase [Desulfovibrio ferrophilus]|uniref:L-aspartate oxidase n=1 Tax=Desulfovibrio ferrophilus TaxID=241368 RepID=A0A2Z6AX16_9BACT|nr:L-aspartate oxidase [Desulfovibrio ferrophilus]BBD07760.1 L-aspartate oxidase [Desulfovibrio ferrophilus]
MNSYRLKTQVLIIGTGIAGSTAALTLADAGLEVTLITADDKPDGGNTTLAQGGIVYKAEDEDPRDLEKDILTAGWKLNNPRAVRYLARKGPQAVEEMLLERLGVKFALSEDGSYDLIREGGHGKGRILHCADYSGRAIMDKLMAAVQEHPGINLLTRRTAVDLLTSHHHANSLEFKYQLTNQCCGAYIFNQELGQVETILADYTLLATGGIGQIYLHTTNTSSSIGSGMVMAARAKAKTINAEYVQFHPTSLFHRAHRKFLVSEAVRGAGAKLINSKGEAFMQRYDSRADLAPRDIVTRAIQEEMLSLGDDCVYLDAVNHVSRDLENSFPTINAKCLEIGVDMTKESIPVVPAAHYFCGGILTDVRGRTTLSRLYAGGECSCTGVHGANRLASTSLLEGLLWGISAGKDIAGRYSKKTTLSRRLADSIPDWVNPGDVKNEDPALIAQDWATLRHTMWNYVGITRTDARLHRAFDDMRSLYRHLQDFYKSTPMSKDIIDLFHGAYAAYIVTLAALRNTESNGCHYRIQQ